MEYDIPYPGCQSLKIRRILKLWKRNREGRKEYPTFSPLLFLLSSLLLFNYFLALVPRVDIPKLGVCVKFAFDDDDDDDGDDDYDDDAGHALKTAIVFLKLQTC